MSQTFQIAFLEAHKEAQKALQKGLVPIGAVLVHHETILVKAHNGPSPLEHAEMLVLKKGFEKIGHQLNECSLFVTLEPCQMCLGAISLCHLKAVYFGAYNSKSIMNPHIPVYGGFYEKENGQLIKKFFTDKRYEKI